jgi:molecular chaperone GrpE
MPRSSTTKRAERLMDGAGVGPPADDDIDQPISAEAGAPVEGAPADAGDLAAPFGGWVDATDPSDIDYSEVDVAAVLKERDEYKGMAQRVQADFDNFRKRTTAQSLAEADRASGRLAEALLPVLDAAEAAYLRHPDEVGPLLNQMLSELKKHGLENLDLEAQPFDPAVAEAVAHEPGDGGEPVVTEVLRSGYLWKGRVLRPAMVKTKD